MDALDLLSDDEEDAAEIEEEEEKEEEEKGESEAGGSVGPEVKRARKADAGKDPPAHTQPLLLLDPERLTAGGTLQDERAAVQRAFQNSFQALQKNAFKEDKPPGRGPECDTRITEELSPTEEPEQLSCEKPPDNIEVGDETGAPVPEPWTTWEEAEDGITKELLKPLRSAGFAKPTSIQAQAWPILRSGRDLIGVAKTGSGKTLAFLLPCFAQILKDGLRATEETTGGLRLPVSMLKQAAGAGAYSPEVLVLAPSRELAHQIELEAQKFTASAGIRTAACYGGATRSVQLGAIRARPECIVATPGRLNDFIETEEHWFGISNVRFLILDEADRMLDEGFEPQIRSITHDVSPKRQTMMFSATWPESVRNLADFVLRSPVEVRVGQDDFLKANPDVDQRVMFCQDDSDKEGLLKSMLRKHYSKGAKDPGKVLVFVGDHFACDRLKKGISMSMRECNVDALHASRSQVDREKALDAFRSGDVPVLVATNVAGRGLDVKGVKLVINFDAPEGPEDYVHRIGRTGRAGESGVAISLLTVRDGKAMAYICQVMRRTGLEIPKDLLLALERRRGRDREIPTT